MKENSSGAQVEAKVVRTLVMHTEAGEVIEVEVLEAMVVAMVEAKEAVEAEEAEEVEDQDIIDTMIKQATQTAESIAASKLRASDS